MATLKGERGDSTYTPRPRATRRGAIRRSAFIESLGCTRPARCLRAVVATTATRPRASKVTVIVPPPATHQRLVRPALRSGGPAARAAAPGPPPRGPGGGAAGGSRGRAGARGPA